MTLIYFFDFWLNRKRALGYEFYHNSVYVTESKTSNV